MRACKRSERTAQRLFEVDELLAADGDAAAAEALLVGAPCRALLTVRRNDRRRCDRAGCPRGRSGAAKWAGRGVWRAAQKSVGLAERQRPGGDLDLVALAALVDDGCDRVAARLGRGDEEDF